MSAGGGPSLEVRSQCAGAIQAIDNDGLLATAIRHDCVLVLPHAVGEIGVLSPAVNDPTTAVQLLGATEDLLVLIGESEVRGRGQLRDREGTVRVLVETRRWEDLLALALTEIRDPPRRA